MSGRIVPPLGEEPEIVDEDGFLVIASQGGEVTDDDIDALRALLTYERLGDDGITVD